MAQKISTCAAFIVAALILAVIFVSDAPAQDLVRVTKSAATCGNGASAQVLAANTGRVLFWVINDSDTAMYFAFGEAAVSGSGLRLGAGGSAFFDSQIPAGVINCITIAGSKNVSIGEGTR